MNDWRSEAGRSKLLPTGRFNVLQMVAASDGSGYFFGPLPLIGDTWPEGAAQHSVTLGDSRVDGMAWKSLDCYVCISRFRWTADGRSHAQALCFDFRSHVPFVLTAYGHSSDSVGRLPNVIRNIGDEKLVSYVYPVRFGVKVEKHHGKSRDSTVRRVDVVRVGAPSEEAWRAFSGREQMMLEWRAEWPQVSGNAKRRQPGEEE